MDLCEYQKKARSTAIYLEIKNSQMIYPALGLIGECGEVTEKIKKLIRDDDGEMTQDRKDSIKKELGDVMWYCANICCDTNLDLDMMYKMRNASMIHRMHSLVLPRLVLYMNRHATSISQSLEQWFYEYDRRENESYRFIPLRSHLTHILTCVEEMAIRCDSTLEKICNINIDKLSGRKERGMLKGSGDNR